MEKITSVSEYVSKVTELTKNKKYVFRGEGECHEVNCIPNIFRDENYGTRREFEKNILDKLRSERIDDSDSYVLTAIEAQHGGFPSRFLDVTFNALIGLHFAVTPFYTSKLDKDDDKDGCVILVEFENLVSPTSEELELVYRKGLLDRESKTNKDIFMSYRHVFIDHYRKNDRIRAQNGAFILFFGNYFRPLCSGIVNL